MTPAAAPISAATAQPAATAAAEGEQTFDAIKADAGRRPVFTAPAAEWKRALGFMLSLTFCGLHVYPAYIITAIMLLNSWRKARSHFIVQLMLFTGTFQLIDYQTLPIWLSDLNLLAGVAFFFLLRNNPLLKRLKQAVAAYAVMLVGFALMSAEALSVQIFTMRNYLSVFWIFVVIASFAGSTGDAAGVGRRDAVDFDVRSFFRAVGVYLMIISVFYCIDCFILNGWGLLPALTNPYGHSTFYELMVRPLNFHFPRRYPSAYYLSVLWVFPLLYYYRMSISQWVLTGITFAAMRTMTVIASLALTYLFFQKNTRRILLYVLLVLALFPAAYAIDSATGGFMRVASTVDQFAELKVAQDDEDLAEFGTGRMAQILPKLDLLISQGRLWKGFGFLHPQLSTSSQFQIHNEFYSDIEYADENVAVVENTQMQAVLNIGLTGLILQTLFFVWLYRLVRHCRLRLYYLSVLVGVSLFGIGGYAGLTNVAGVYLVMTALGVVILDQYHVDAAAEAERDKAGGDSLT